MSFIDHPVTQPFIEFAFLHPGAHDEFTAAAHAHGLRTSRMKTRSAPAR